MTSPLPGAARPDTRSDFPGDVRAILVLSLAPAVALGLARFAYALILPDMRADLAWSFSEAGWMNGSNAFGYLLGAVVAAFVIGRAGARATMVAGAVLCALSMIACALSRDVLVLNVARLLAGIGGAFAFVAGGVLATAIAQRHPERGTFLLGLFYGGPGIGIVISGFAVPLVLTTGLGHWQAAWMVLALLTLPMAAALWFGPAGSAPAVPQTGGRAPLMPMAFILVGYFGFGAGYIAYMTFMFAWLRDQGSGIGLQVLFWSVLGLACFATPWIWTGVLQHLKRGFAFSALTAVTALGAALPLLSGTLPAVLVSAALFGSSFLAVVAATTMFVRRNLPHGQWAAGISAMSVAFGIGQTAGPVLTGWVVDHVGGLSSGLWSSVALLMGGVLIGLLQGDLPLRPVKPSPAE